MKRFAMILGTLLAVANPVMAEETAPAQDPQGSPTQVENMTDEGTALDNLTIENPYAYATTSVQKNGAVFMKIHREDMLEKGKPENYTSQQMFLTGAETDVAERVELHTHLMDGGIMKMREVDGYEVQNNDVLTLEPMGHHIMLFGLKAPLEAGSEFPMTLYFDDKNTRETTVKVVKPGESP